MRVRENPLVRIKRAGPEAILICWQYCKSSHASFQTKPSTFQNQLFTHWKTRFDSPTFDCFLTLVFIMFHLTETTRFTTNLRTALWVSSSNSISHGDAVKRLTVSRYGMKSKFMSFQSNFIFSIPFSSEYSLLADTWISSSLWIKITKTRIEITYIYPRRQSIP